MNPFDYGAVHRNGGVAAFAFGGAPIAAAAFGGGLIDERPVIQVSPGRFRFPNRTSAILKIIGKLYLRKSTGWGFGEVFRLEKTDQTEVEYHHFIPPPPGCGWLRSSFLKEMD
jgi:hypothetical protein